VDIGKNMSVVRAISYISVFNNLLMVILLSSSGSLNLATHQNKLHSLYGVGIHVCFCYGLTENTWPHVAVNGGPGCSSMIGRMYTLLSGRKQKLMLDHLLAVFEGGHILRLDNAET
jgi:hypothetical protein